MRPHQESTAARGGIVRPRLGVTELAFDPSSGPRRVPCEGSHRAGRIRAMPNPDRLTGLDASFLLARAQRRAHARRLRARVRGRARPTTSDFLANLQARLHLVPRYRQKLAWPPLVQGRPVWIDDPHFNAGYHVRHTALPAPAGEEELQRLAGRVFAQGLDRSKPLWEMWLVDRVGERPLRAGLQDPPRAGRRRLGRRHLDGPLRPRARPAGAATRRRRGSRARSRARRSLLADARSRSGRPAPMDALRSLGTRAARGREKALARERPRRRRPGRDGRPPGSRAAPPSPLNVRIGPHRRFAWVEADLDRFKAIKYALGGTVNDVVLAVVTGALRAVRHRAAGATSTASSSRRWCRSRCARRPSAARSATASRRCTRRCRSTRRIRSSGSGSCTRRWPASRSPGRRSAREVLTRLAGFAAPTMLDQAARLQARQRFFNVDGHQRARPAVPALPAGAAAARVLSAGAADAQHGARDRDHVLRRTARLRPARRLRRAAGAGRRRRGARSARSASSRPRPASPEDGSGRRRPARRRKAAAK